MIGRGARSYEASIAAGMVRPSWVGLRTRKQRLPVPGEVGVLIAAALMAWLCDTHPADLPVWTPWGFSWTAFLGLGFVLVWFCRGSRCGHALSWPRSLCFLTGLAAIYVVTLTHFDYAAQHMFFVNRIQHAVLHHLAPFLIALSWPVEPIGNGLPAWLRRLPGGACLRRTLRLLQSPWLAFLLFEGLLALWLVPPITFRAMLDPHLYAIMNASMLVDGLLFWFLVLDPRPNAGIGFFTRLALDFLVIFPQIALGTALGLARTDLYPSFNLCGRLIPGIDALADQQIGGMILWVPAGMMSAYGAVLIMSRMFAHEDGAAQAAT